MTFVRIGRRKGRLGILGRSMLVWGGPPHAPAAMSIRAFSNMDVRPARIVSASLLWGDAAEMSVHAVAIHRGEAYWGDASEMEATGGVVP